MDFFQHLDNKSHGGVYTLEQYKEEMASIDELKKTYNMYFNRLINVLNRNEDRRFESAWKK